ncbi:MAG: conserved rane protein of unknown function, partial [Planctomycetaceae bacterium]|nr:conserved rane protein of unknown function [Planctomycetaceae bacterium]
MKLDLKLILDTAGPTATLVFASWIFLQYLNQRFADASLRYRELLSEFREHSDHDVRHRSLQEQILRYRTRCGRLGRATGLGLFAAFFLLATLLLCITSMASHQPLILSLASLICSVIGITLLIVSVALAWSE